MPTPLSAHAEVFVSGTDLVDFEVFQTEIVRDFEPRTEFECQCVRTIIHSLWTIRRTRIVERRMQERAQTEGITDPLLDIAWARQLRGVLQMRRQAERSQQLALKDLRASRDGAAGGPVEPEPVAVLHATAAGDVCEMSENLEAAANVMEMPAGLARNLRVATLHAKRAAAPVVETGLPPLQDLPLSLPDRNGNGVGRHAAGRHHDRLAA